MASVPQELIRYFCRENYVMDQDTIFLLVIGALGGAAILFRKWYLAQPRSYKVSEQWHNAIRMVVTEHNPRKETAVIEIELSPVTSVPEVDCFMVEFISKKRELERKTLTELGITEISISYDGKNKSVTCTFEKRDLMRGIRSFDIKLYRFRFVVGVTKVSLNKSPEFAFSSKSMLFRPDTGKYN